MPLEKELQKILSGNRITLPSSYVVNQGLKQGDPVILEWMLESDAWLKITPVEVHKRESKK